MQYFINKIASQRFLKTAVYCSLLNFIGNLSELAELFLYGSKDWTLRVLPISTCQYLSVSYLYFQLGYFTSYRHSHFFSSYTMTFFSHTQYFINNNASERLLYPIQSLPVFNFVLLRHRNQAFHILPASCDCFQYKMCQWKGKCAKEPKNTLRMLGYWIHILRDG